MNIWVFQTGEPLPSDEINARPMRAMNLAYALVEAGHSVTIWSSAFFHQQKLHRSVVSKQIIINDFLKVYLIASPGYSRNIGLGRLVDHAVLAFNLSKALSKELVKPDVAFIGYPPIEFSCVAVNWLKLRGVPTMLDAKDQWPEIFVEYFPELFRPIMRILFFPYFFLGRNVMRQASAFCSMSQGFLDWMAKFSGRAISSFDCVVPLSPMEHRLSQECISEAELWWKEIGVSNDGRKRVFFVGSLSQAFDFEPIVEAATRAEASGKDWQFVICGNGEKYDYLKQKSVGLSNVVLPGWIDRQKIIALSSMSILGLAPYRNTDNFLNGIPNKIIDYLSLGKPIFTPLRGEVLDIINKYGVGIYYDETNIDDMFNKMDKYCDRDYIVDEMSKKSKIIYNKYFSGEKVYKDLVDKLVSLSKCI